MTPLRQGVLVMAALAAALLALAGCARGGAQPGRASAGAASAQPAIEASDTANVAELTATRDRVMRYIYDAQAGDRAAMIAAYLPETRRSAETVVARDLELAHRDGPLGQGLSGLASVYRDPRGRLQPPRPASEVLAEQDARLAELEKAHERALIVVMEFRDGSTRTVFLVRDAAEWFLLP